MDSWLNPASLRSVQEQRQDLLDMPVLSLWVPERRDVSISDAQAIATISNDDIPPTITSGNLATALENAPPSTVVYTATAINNTGSASEIAWSLGGANANDFTINSSGQLRFKTSPDYEAKSSFNLEIIATDRNGTGSSAAKAVHARPVRVKRKRNERLFPESCGAALSTRPEAAARRAHELSGVL